MRERRRVYNYNLVCELICSGCHGGEDDDSQNSSGQRVKFVIFYDRKRRMDEYEEEVSG